MRKKGAGFLLIGVFAAGIIMVGYAVFYFLFNPKNPLTTLNNAKTKSINQFSLASPSNTEIDSLKTDTDSILIEDYENDFKELQIDASTL